MFEDWLIRCMTLTHDKILTLNIARIKIIHDISHQKASKKFQVFRRVFEEWMSPIATNNVPF